MPQPVTSRRQFLVWSLRAAGTAAAGAFPWIGASAAVGGVNPVRRSVPIRLAATVQFQ